MWDYEDRNTLAHKSGFKVVLIDGSWREPMDLETKVPKNVGVTEASQRLREGLNYASRNPFKLAQEKRPIRKPGKNTLSLRKKKE